MKKIIALTLAGSVLFFSCSHKSKEIKKVPENQVQSKEWKNEFQNAPIWVLNPQAVKKDYKGLVAVGSAKIGKAGIQFARTEALANARDELARMMSVKVKNMVKNFTQQIGIGNEQTVDKVSVQVSKQISSIVLHGSMQKDIWISPSKELYVLVVLDPQEVKEAIKQDTLASFKNDKALWQQFQSKKGFEELEKEVEKEFEGNKEKLNYNFKYHNPINN